MYQPAMTTSERDGTEPGEITTQRDIDDRLDSYIKETSDKIEQRYAEQPEPSERKSLDQMLDENIAKAEREHADHESEQRGRPHRETLERRNGQDINAQIRSFARWVQAFRANPGLAANQLVGHYYRPHLAEPEEKAPDASDPRTHSKLDAILANAIEQHSTGSEPLTAESKAIMDQMFPGLPRDEQLRQMDKLEQDLMANPHETAARLGALFGMAATPLQIKEQQAQQAFAEQETASLSNWLNQQVAAVPHLHAIRHDVAEVLSHPAFVSTDDPQDCLSRAYAIAVGARQHAAAHGVSISDVLAHGRQLAEDRKLVDHINQFAETVGPERLESVRYEMGKLLEQGKAESLADAYHKATEIKLRRAQRARPVKASGTVSSSSGSGASLDSLIGDAIGRHGL